MSIGVVAPDATGSFAGDRPRVLGLVADDVTGAGDSAAAFAEHGWRVVLHLRKGPLRPSGTADPRPTVIAVSTGARALSDDDAAMGTAEAVRRLREAGAERLFVKIDSTVRGSVAGQVSGAVQAWASAPVRAVICPAFPGQGRTVVSGQVRVDGVPLEQTPAATDPVTPRTTGDLERIFPSARRGGPADLGRASQLILDAESDHDLDRIADRLGAEDDTTVVVGSGGLAAALARRWATAPLSTHWRPVPAAAGRVLVAVSSPHPATQRQIAQLRCSPVGPYVDVLTAGPPDGASPVAVATELAHRAAGALAALPYTALITVGGDGAAAILSRLEADLITFDGVIIEGCPTGVVTAGVADGLRLVTKSGGFGPPETLVTLSTRLRATARHDSDPEPAPHPFPGSDRPTPKDFS